MSSLSSYFDGLFPRELMHFTCGKMLGSGVGRQVYIYKPDPKYVLKFETASGSFQNATEWETWKGFKEHEPTAKWLAPCVQISDCGLILMQERTDVIRKAELPEMVPCWATDTKIGNWGLLNGRPVMHDYGYVLEQLPKRMKKAEWWGFEDE